tara:strand:+ start:86 stop:580 length:495 start_codon:yes stop_codon:yes gene_type:complete
VLFLENFAFSIDKQGRIAYNIHIMKKEETTNNADQTIFDSVLWVAHKIDNLINAIYIKGVDMAQAKNYTEEMVNTMTEQYQANPTRETVDALADQFGKTTRSIIAKLSREGVYVAQPRTTKSGEPVVSKSELVAQINEHFGIEMPTLVKAGKQDLQRLVDAINS